jgi:hypothetical protein
MSRFKKSGMLQLVSEHDPRTNIFGMGRSYMTHVMCDLYMLLNLNWWLSDILLAWQVVLNLLLLSWSLLWLLHKGSDMIWPVWCYLLTAYVSWCWFWIVLYYFKGVCVLELGAFYHIDCSFSLVECRILLPASSYCTIVTFRLT